MAPHISRDQRIVEVFTNDTRPGADSFVYCKGCGESLVGQARHQKAKVKVTTMMCEKCQKRHGHALMPKPGAPSFCYRCGEPDAIVVEEGFSPVTHHLCPRCVPERLARYRAGDFETPLQDRATQGE
ncbi:MAG: hypothetical protein NVSMB52_19120 [Chloroflexota bacterium]